MAKNTVYPKPTVRKMADNLTIANEFRALKYLFSAFLLPLQNLSICSTIIYWILHSFNIGIHIAVVLFPIFVMVIHTLDQSEVTLLSSTFGYTIFFNVTIKCSIFAINYIWIAFKRAQIARLVGDLEQEFMKMSAESRGCVTRKLRYAIAVSVTATVACLTNGVLNLNSEINKFDGISPFKNGTYESNIALLISFNIWDLYSRPLYIVTIIFFVFVCHLLNEILDEPAEKAKSRLELDTFEGTRNQVEKIVFKLMIEHRTACALIAQADHVFSVFNVLTLTLEVLSMVFQFRILGELGKAFEYETLVTVFLTVATFSAKCVAAATVNDKVLDTIRNIPGVDITVPNVATRTEMSSQVQANFQIYLNKISMRPPALTGAQFFTISRGLLLTSFGTVITYTLILYGK